jgi:uroporphyrinogen-III decarboxylase
MTSRERVNAALRRQPVDRVPLVTWFFHNHIPARGSNHSIRELIEYQLREQDLDSMVPMGLVGVIDPQVTSDFSISDDGKLLTKTFRTPDGDLSASVRYDDNLPVKDDVELFSDFNGPLFVKPWIETLDDVERFAWVNRPPEGDALEQLRERLAKQRAFADEYDLALVVTTGYGATRVVSMMGGEQAMYASMDCPEVIERLLEVEQVTNLRLCEIAIECGADAIIRNGFYETCDFWSPQQVRDWIMPKVNEQARFIHSLGATMSYTVCTGVLPLLDQYRESDIDSLNTFETKLMGQSLKAIVDGLQGEKCLWGGISDCEDLGRATPEQTRQAVREAFELIGRRGFIMCATPSIKPERPLACVEAMFDEWRKLRDNPDWDD